MLPLEQSAPMLYARGYRAHTETQAPARPYQFKNCLRHPRNYTREKTTHTAIDICCLSESVLSCAQNWNTAFGHLSLAALRHCWVLWKSTLQIPLWVVLLPLCSLPCLVTIIYTFPSASDDTLTLWKPKSHPLQLSPLGHKCSWTAGIYFVNRQLKLRRKINVSQLNLAQS